MLVIKDGIMHNISDKRLSEFKEKGYTQYIPPVIEQNPTKTKSKKSEGGN